MGWYKMGKQKIVDCKEFLTDDCGQKKILQKNAINMHRQDVEYDYLHAYFRALEQQRKKE
jgi:hypothetical protein